MSARQMLTSIEEDQRQYEPRPRPTRKSDRRDLWKLIALGAASIILPVFIFWAGTVRADPGFISKGVICDSLDQLIERLDTREDVEGCGMYRAPGMVPVDITVLGKYETSLAIFALARIIIPNIGIQYGYVAVEAKAPPPPKIPEVGT